MKAFVLILKSTFSALFSELIILHRSTKNVNTSSKSSAFLIWDSRLRGRVTIMPEIKSIKSLSWIILHDGKTALDC